jgi:hypothetical protein
VLPRLSDVHRAFVGSALNDQPHGRAAVG